MNHLLDTTGIQNKKLSLNERVQRVCLSDSSVPTVCPSITLLFAVRYIERLKQVKRSTGGVYVKITYWLFCFSPKRYGDVHGNNGCARRLVLVAYIIAAKYIQSNMRAIVDVTDLPPLAKPISSTERRQSQDLTLPGLSTERRLSSAMLLSPLVSPKIPDITDPSQYHYFHGADVSSNLGLPEHDERTTMPSVSFIGLDFNHHIWRMESEFLHFLNGDVKVPNCLRLMEWAHSSWLGLIPLLFLYSPTLKYSTQCGACK